MRRRLALVCLAVLLGALAVLGYTALQARTALAHLRAAKADAARVSASLAHGDLDAAARGLPALDAELKRADAHAHGWSWRVSTVVPGAGGSFRSVQSVATAGSRLGSSVLPEAQRVLDRLRQHPLLVRGKVDLAELADLTARLRAQQGAADAAVAVLKRPRGWTPAPVRSAYDAARERVVALDDGLRSLTSGLGVAPTMLGSGGTRTWLVLVQNNAESRATGGLIGAYAVLRAQGGKLTLVRSGTNRDLVQSAVPVTALPGAARTWQDIGSTRAWFDANLTPSFPDVGTTAAALWEHQGQPRVDGVIALDAVGLGHLLEGVGAVTTADGVRVPAADLARFIEYDEYRHYRDNDARKLVLADLTRRAVDALLSSGDGPAALRGVVSATRNGRLRVWSRVAGEQEVLAPSVVGGALPTSGTAFLGVVTQNFAGNKLDYFLRRKVTVQRLDGSRVAVRVQLLNAAPLGLPTSMTVRADTAAPRPYAESLLSLAVYTATSAQVSDVRVDGAPVLLQSDRDHDTALGSTTITLPRGTVVSVDFIMRLRAGTVLQYRQQPLAVDDTLDLRVPYVRRR